MKTTISLTLLITTIMFQTYAIPQEKKYHQNLIETTCKNTPNYGLCTTTLRGSAAADVAGLGLIMVSAVKSKTREALSAVNKLRRINPRLSAPLQKCAEAYNGVLNGDVPVAEASVRGNPKFAENGMADAAVEADVCDEAFGGKTLPAALGGANKAVRDLAVVARAVIRNLL